MEYHERRLNPFKSVALYWHVHRCEDCRELFLAMDTASEAAVSHETLTECPAEGFAAAIMTKISDLPAWEHPKRPVSPIPSASKSSIDWVRLAGCLYALLLAAGLGIMYNTELVQIPYSSFGTGEWLDALLASLSHIGQSATVNATVIVGDAGNYVLAIAAVLGLALVFMVQREKSFAKRYQRYD